MRRTTGSPPSMPDSESTNRWTVTHETADRAKETNAIFENVAAVKAAGEC